MHAHFDCFSGISGDMVLGAFVDLGVCPRWLTQQLQGLGIGAVAVVARDVKRHGIAAKQIDIAAPADPPGRHWREIRRLIEGAALGEAVKGIALDIFNRLAEAEARVHRCSVEQVHFHEVGAVDSIADVVGAALCVDHLNITGVSASPLPLGSGFVACAHGRLPVPAPATLEILKGIPVQGGTLEGERVTPTGAAIIAALARTFGPLPPMAIERIGYGSGTRDSAGVPNLLRVILGRSTGLSTGLAAQEAIVVETNIDDMNPELFGFVMEKLFAAGALDVSYVPVMMKKNRPGTKVEVICPPHCREAVVGCLLTETTTIGVRCHGVSRFLLRRFAATAATVYGDILVKGVIGPDGVGRYAPEYEACRQVALDRRIALKEVYAAAAQAVRQGAVSPRQKESQPSPPGPDRHDHG